MSKAINIRGLLQWQVRTKLMDIFTEGYDSQQAAMTSAAFKNGRAQELGIQERYAVKENPNFDQDTLNQARQSAGIKVNHTK